MLTIDVGGLVVLWLGVVGPVLALAGSLAAFVVIWVKDWPVPRPRTEERFVRVEELATEDRGECSSRSNVPFQQRGNA